MIDKDREILELREEIDKLSAIIKAAMQDMRQMAIYDNQCAVCKYKDECKETENVCYCTSWKWRYKK